MSIGYEPKNEQTMGQSLKVQELVVSGGDPSLYQVVSSVAYVMIREPVEKVFLARCKIDASNTFQEFKAASVSIVDSSSLSSGGDKGAIKLSGLTALAANDVIIVRYSVDESL